MPISLTIPISLCLCLLVSKIWFTKAKRHKNQKRKQRPLVLSLLSAALPDLAYKHTHRVLCWSVRKPFWLFTSLIRSTPHLWFIFFCVDEKPPIKRVCVSLFIVAFSHFHSCGIKMRTWNKSHTNMKVFFLWYFFLVMGIN